MYCSIAESIYVVSLLLQIHNNAIIIFGMCRFRTFNEIPWDFVRTQYCTCFLKPLIQPFYFLLFRDKHFFFIIRTRRE